MSQNSYLDFCKICGGRIVSVDYELVCSKCGATYGELSSSFHQVYDLKSAQLPEGLRLGSFMGSRYNHEPSSNLSFSASTYSYMKITSDLNDLGILVTMKRPNQMMSGRIVSRISEVDESMQVRDLYRREEDSPLSMPSERLLKKAYDLTDAKFNSVIGKSLDLLLSAIEKRAYDLKDFAALVWKKVSSDVE